MTPPSGLSSLFCQPRALLINARRAQQSLYTIKGGVKGVRGREKEDGSTEKAGKGEAECITVEKNGGAFDDELFTALCSGVQAFTSISGFLLFHRADS